MSERHCKSPEWLFSQYFLGRMPLSAFLPAILGRLCSFESGLPALLLAHLCFPATFLSRQSLYCGVSQFVAHGNVVA
jgi:hypothetical protein